MSDKFKNSKFYHAMKNPKVSRAIYVSLVLLLVAVAVTVGIVAAANRAKRNEAVPPRNTAAKPSEDTPTPHENTTAPIPDVTTAPDPGAAVTQPQGDTPVVNALPTFSLPTAGKALKYHDAKVQVFSTTMNDYRVHLGVDIATAAGAPVYAAADGTVQKIWKDPLMGYCLALSHSGDAVTIYKNLADTLPDGVVEGAKLKAGQQIASVGESAMIEVAEEPHLHLEMTVAGLQVNPLDYFSANDLKSLSVDASYGE